jgi:hypothetical protein
MARLLHHHIPACIKNAETQFGIKHAETLPIKHAETRIGSSKDVETGKSPPEQQLTADLQGTLVSALA